MSIVEHNLLIVSDLHLSEGWSQRTGRCGRLEDFTYDEAFWRFLSYHESLRTTSPALEGRPWKLLFNGDMLQFLQVLSLPPEGEELAQVTGVSTYAELPRDVLRYGLEAGVKESVWKLKRIAAGHSLFFSALGWFLAHGNHIAVLKGNHDVEFYWPQVQQQFRHEIQQAYRCWRETGGDEGPDLLEQDLEQVCFYPRFYYEKGRVYAEHGHQYDPSCRFRDFLTPVQPANPDQIAMPWLTMVGQRLSNYLGYTFPLVDLEKLMTQKMVEALRENPAAAVGLAWHYANLFARMGWREIEHHVIRRQKAGKSAPKQYTGVDVGFSFLPDKVVQQLLRGRRLPRSTTVKQALRLAAQFSATVVLLSCEFATVFLAVRDFVDAYYGRMVGWLAIGAVVYAMRQVINERLKRQVSQLNYAGQVVPHIRQALGAEYGVPCYVLGHTHRPTLLRLDEKAWFVEGGAWPGYVMEEKWQFERHFTFLRLLIDDQGPPELLHWNDQAGRPERVMLMEPRSKTFG